MQSTNEVSAEQNNNAAEIRSMRLSGVIFRTICVGLFLVAVILMLFCPTLKVSLDSEFAQALGMTQENWESLSAEEQSDVLENMDEEEQTYFLQVVYGAQASVFDALTDSFDEIESAQENNSFDEENAGFLPEPEHAGGFSRAITFYAYNNSVGTELPNRAAAFLLLGIIEIVYLLMWITALIACIILIVSTIRLWTDPKRPIVKSKLSRSILIAVFPSVVSLVCGIAGIGLTCPVGALVAILIVSVAGFVSGVLANSRAKKLSDAAYSKAAEM